MGVETNITLEPLKFFVELPLERWQAGKERRCGLDRR
jgi:hypothetical protein